MKKGTLHLGQVLLLSLAAGLQCGVDAEWFVSTPGTASTRARDANVAGSGLIAMTGDATTATFQFGPDVNGVFSMENEITVFAQTMGAFRYWGGTLPPPTALWSVSPLVGNPPVLDGQHSAVILFGRGNSTDDHKVTAT